ncbi:MAG: Tm-1-like ATP-binding domain-containing protein, partial [Xanthobacteraceae bacterium]
MAVLATLDTKGKEARFVAEVLARAGAIPWIMDLSLKPHDRGGADATAANVAAAAGASWPALSERSRPDAAGVMAEGGRRILLDRVVSGEISGG